MGQAASAAASAGIVGAGAATPPSDDSSVWRSTISAALRSGMPAGGDPEASEASRNSPDFWKAFLTSPPVRF